MKVYKSISAKDIEQPYIFKETSQKIYSFEGLIFYCFEHWLEAMGILETEAFKYFISETLMLKKKHNDIVNLLHKNYSSSKKLIKLIESSNLFTTNQLKKLQIEIDSWESQPLNIRYKTLGDQSFGTKKYVKAIEYYRQAQATLFDPIVEHNIGIAYLKLYFFQEAEKALVKAAARSDKIEIQLSLVRLLKITNRFDQALFRAEVLLERNRTLEVILECGLLYQLQGRYEKALELFSEAYEIERSQEILIKMMEVSLEISPNHELLEDIESLPKKEQYYLLKSKIFTKNNQLEAAIEILEEGVTTAQDNSMLYVALSKLYRKNKQIIKAIGAITQAANNKVPNDEILFEMARIAKRAGNWTDYEAKIDELLKLWKNDVRRRFS